MKKKKIWSVVALLLVCCQLMSGCGREQEIAITKNPISYAYEQELNVIDDNYRNYYEVFVRSFYDSDGDGIGDLAGLTEKLDYIEDMGFNGIWLMPIMKSTTYHKYDVVDYYEIDPEYGTMEDFEKLVKECHKRDIHLIIDFVMNHSSSQNQWFLDACSYLEGLKEGENPDESVCPEVGYYHFDTEQVNSTYYKAGNSDFYYEGSFWSEMPDLNFSSDKLRAEFEQIADFWVDKGVDGFRMDAALHFEEYEPEFNKEVLNWMFNHCREKNPEFYMVSEVWAGQDTIADYYGSGTPSMFNFTCSQAEGILMKAGRSNARASKLVDTMLSCQESFLEQNPDYIDAPFLTNHDNIRVSNGCMEDGDVKMCAGVLLMMNGSPFVYYGEEIGMRSTGQKDEDKRLPMDWYGDDTTDKEGMTTAPKGATKGASNNYPSVEEQLTDGYSILNYYKRGLRLRNENPEIARGTIAVVEALKGDNVAAITKTYEDSTIGIVYNLSREEQKVTITDSELAQMGIRGYLTLKGEEITLTDGELIMPAQSICILK